MKLPSDVKAATHGLRRIVLGDEHISIRELLQESLVKNSGFDVIGVAGTGPDTLRMCRQLAPDLLIMELSLPEMGGAEVLGELKADRSPVRCLIHTGVRRPEVLVAALRGHPHGFVHKSQPLATFREALRTVSSGGRYLCSFGSSVLDEAFAHEVAPNLSNRERTILRLIADGAANKQIASVLGLATKTVHHYRGTLMSKLRIHDVATLTRLAVRMGLVD